MSPEPEENADLVAQRDRLLEKFTIMQADLGGAFYEMAIRDHVRMDVLTRKAAELQRVDAELLAAEQMLELLRVRRLRRAIARRRRGGCRVADRQALRAAGRLLGGRHRGDRRRAMTGTGNSGALAALLGRRLASGTAPAASGPVAASSLPGGGGGEQPVGAGGKPVRRRRAARP